MLKIIKELIKNIKILKKFIIKKMNQYINKFIKLCKIQKKVF